MPGQCHSVCACVLVTDKEKQKKKRTTQKARQFITGSIPNAAESHPKWQMWRGRRFSPRKARELFWGNLLENAAKGLENWCRDVVLACTSIHSFTHSLIHAHMHARTDPQKVEKPLGAVHKPCLWETHSMLGNCRSMPFIMRSTSGNVGAHPGGHRVEEGLWEVVRES